MGVFDMRKCIVGLLVACMCMHMLGREKAFAKEHIIWSRPCNIGGVTIGMTKDQVISVVGKPDREWPYNDVHRRVWKYGIGNHKHPALYEIDFGDESSKVEAVHGYELRQANVQILQSNDDAQAVTAKIGHPSAKQGGWWHYNKSGQTITLMMTDDDRTLATVTLGKLPLK